MKTIFIRVPKAAKDSTLVSTLHVADEIFGKFRLDGIAQIPSLDSFLTEFRIMVPATRNLGVVTTLIKKALRRHGLEELVEITRGDL